MASTEHDCLAVAWCKADRSCAVVPADHRIIDESASVRVMIVGFARLGGSDEELYDACAVFGRLIARLGGTPTLASQTIDHAGDVLGAPGARWVGPARAALLEAFASALLEKARQDAMESWDFPKCVVPLSETRIAIAAGHPSEDPEVLSDWAARIANAAALKGVRQAVVSGAEPARAAVEEALAVVGIDFGR
jgi:hypothetical protein